MVAHQDADDLSTLPDDELARRATSDDAAVREAAITILYERHRGGVWPLVFGRVGHQQEAEEVMSVVFSSAFDALRGFDPARGTFRAWLRGIAYHKAMDYWRRHYAKAAKAPRFKAAPPARAPKSSRIEWDSAVDVIASVRARLSPQQNAILALKLEGLSGKEIAFALGKDRRVIDVQWFRIRRKLRHALGDRLAGREPDRPPPRDPSLPTPAAARQFS